jgi:ferric-dicitrate binding protein FerR (iron transport regulator)
VHLTAGVQFFQAASGSIANLDARRRLDPGGHERRRTRAPMQRHRLNPVVFGGYGSAAAANNSNLMPDDQASSTRAQIRNNVLDDGTGIQLDVDFTTGIHASGSTPSPSHQATRQR